MTDHQEEAHPEAEVDIQFKPIIKLPHVEVKTLEDDEDEIYRQRAKLFRYHANGDDGPEWKERGIGDMRILKHRKTEQCRLVMRRDQTFKVCCNHFITGKMKLAPIGISDREFVWSTFADFADEEKKEEVLAIRFKNSEIAEKFKNTFEECVETVKDGQKQEETEEQPVTENSSGDAAISNSAESSQTKNTESGDITPTKCADKEKTNASDVDTVVENMKGLAVKSENKKETDNSIDK